MLGRSGLGICYGLLLFISASKAGQDPSLAQDLLNPEGPVGEAIWNQIPKPIPCKSFWILIPPKWLTLDLGQSNREGSLGGPPDIACALVPGGGAPQRHDPHVGRGVSEARPLICVSARPRVDEALLTELKSALVTVVRLWGLIWDI